jgi:Protein of unknown function (DUF3433)
LIAVLYSTWWSWVDLDVKRLEPWYQLVSTKRAKAQCSLLLQYPIEFIAWIPVRAARRKYVDLPSPKSGTLFTRNTREWAVASASLTTVCIFWAVTPLQSGVFTVALATVSQNVSVSSPAHLLPSSKQVEILDANLVNAAYGVTWLGQTLPPFTTRDFALAPLSWQDLDLAGRNASLLANTTLYRANLTCDAPASVEATNISNTFLVDDGEDCREESDITRPLAWQGGNGYQAIVCNKYLIIWNKQELPDRQLNNLSDVVVRFCKTTYYSQPVQANVSIPEGRIFQTWALGSQLALSADEFNTTVFEFLLTMGHPLIIGDQLELPQQTMPQPFDVSEDTVLSQGLRLSQRGYPQLNSVLAGLAVGGQDLPFDLFVNNTEAIDAAFLGAQQLLFALAVSTLTYNYNLSEPSQPGICTFSIQSIQLVPAITRSLQTFLGLIVVLITVLAFVYYNNFLPLGSDPGSIGYLAAVASRRKFINHFEPMDRERDLAERLRRKQATLRRQGGELFLSLHSSNPESHVEDDTRGGGIIEVGAGVAKQHILRNAWPSELKLSTGIAFVLVMSLAAAGLVFLDAWIRTHQGLPLPSTNAVARQIVLNYIPTVRPLLPLLPMCLRKGTADACTRSLALSLSLFSQ